MAVADGGAATAAKSGTSPQTTGTFTPTAGTGVLLTVSAAEPGSGTPLGGVTVTWATGGTGATPWVLLGSEIVNVFEPSAQIWWSYIPPGASPGSSSITVTAANALSAWVKFDTRIVTGADPFPAGASGTAANVAGATISVTPLATGSLVYTADADQNESGSTWTAAASTTVLSGIAPVGGQGAWSTVTTSTTTAGSAVTPGITQTLTGHVGVAVEILPAGVCVTEDINSPAVTSTVAAFNVTPLSSSYTPPVAKMTVLVIVSSSTAANVTGTTTVSDGSVTYTLLKRQNTVASANGNCVEIWAHDYASAPGALTITSTAANTNSKGGAMIVRGLLNTSSSNLGNTNGQSNPAAAALDLSFTPIASGNRVYGGGSAFASSAALTTSNVTSLFSVSDATNTDRYAGFRATALTTGSATTLGYSSSVKGQLAMVEMKVVTAAVTATPSSILIAI